MYLTLPQAYEMSFNLNISYGYIAFLSADCAYGHFTLRSIAYKVLVLNNDRDILDLNAYLII